MDIDIIPINIDHFYLRVPCDFSDSCGMILITCLFINYISLATHGFTLTTNKSWIKMLMTLNLKTKKNSDLIQNTKLHVRIV